MQFPPPVAGVPPTGDSSADTSRPVVLGEGRGRIIAASPTRSSGEATTLNRRAENEYSDPRDSLLRGETYAATGNAVPVNDTSTSRWIGCFT